MAATLKDIKTWVDSLSDAELSLPAVFRIEARSGEYIMCADYPLTGAYIDTDTLEGVLHTDPQIEKTRNDIN